MSRIRPCRDDEQPAILAIINAAAAAYRCAIPADRWHEPYMAAGELEREIDQGVVFWGYEADDALIGVMGIQAVGDVDLIRHAYVLPASQRAGVGRELLAHLRLAEYASHARRYLGGRRMGDPLLPAQRLRAGLTRTQDGAAADVLDDPRPSDRDLGGAREPATRRELAEIFEPLTAA